MENRLISSAELKDNLGNKEVKILDIRDEDAYKLGYIPGATNSSPGVFDDPSLGLPALLGKQDIFKNLMSTYGIEESDKVVIYSSVESVQAATRVYWAMKVGGHEDISILDGQLEGWIRQGGQIEKDPILNREESAYKLSQGNSQLNVDSAYVLDIIENKKDTIILDCRMPEEYGSQGPANQMNQRGGHIPGAINLGHIQTLDEAKKFKSKEDLEKLFASLGIDGSKEIVTYCQTGYRATVCWFALSEILGYDRVRVYDGSYIQWSNDLSLPVE